MERMLMNLPLERSSGQSRGSVGLGLWGDRRCASAKISPHFRSPPLPPPSHWAMHPGPWSDVPAFGRADESAPAVDDPGLAEVFAENLFERFRRNFERNLASGVFLVCAAISLSTKESS